MQNNVELGTLLGLAMMLITFQTMAIVVYLIAREKLTKSRFLRFLAILLIGMVSSLVPFGPLGLVMGFPAVFTAAILTSLILDKDEPK